MKRPTVDQYCWPSTPGSMGKTAIGTLERLAEYVIEKAISGHFGFFKLLLDMVDGPIGRENDQGRLFPDNRTLVMIADRRDSEIAIAA